MRNEETKKSIKIVTEHFHYLKYTYQWSCTFNTTSGIEYYHTTMISYAVLINGYLNIIIFHKCTALLNKWSLGKHQRLLSNILNIFSKPNFWMVVFLNLNMLVRYSFCDCWLIRKYWLYCVLCLHYRWSGRKMIWTVIRTSSLCLLMDEWCLGLW